MTAEQDRFYMLARSHGERVLGYLLRRADNHEDAADVYQQVLSTTWRKLDSVPQGEAALGWMIGVARRELANFVRGERRGRAATERLVSELHTLVQGSRQNDVADAVIDAINQLSEKDRDIITMTYWDGFTSQEIGEALHISPAGVRKRLERGRQTLGAALGR